MSNHLRNADYLGSMKPFSNSVSQDPKGISTVDIDSLSHHLQGFIHPNGGWPWDF